MFAVIKNDGYIQGIASGRQVGGEVISEAEYHRIKAVLLNTPKAPPGYTYRLREDLEWELVELPPAPDVPEEATPDDLINALRDMGVSV